MSISLCVIVKNEENYLEQALSSISNLVQEIIIVDTGSKDKTIEIAKRFTPKIFKIEWPNDFSEARNFSISKATKDWILILDADEIISKQDQDKIKQLIQDPNYDAYSFIQVSYTNDISQFSFTPIREPTEESKDFKGYISCNMIRLFRNNKKIIYENPVHESVDKSVDKNRIKKTSIKLHHYQFEKGDENQKEKQLSYLKIYETKIDKFKNKAKVYRDMGIINYSFKNDYDKAIENFKKSLEINPSNLKTIVGLALSYFKKNNFKEALEILNKGLTLDPNNKQIQHLIEHIQKTKR